MTIGVFYICTGKYSIFWHTFYESAEKYFAPGVRKIYYVFTDDASIKEKDNIKTFFEKPKGFPMDSLLRFDMFLKIKENTAICDYLFFFNANMKFVEPVQPAQILPTKEENGLTAVLHPGYFNSSNVLMLPYEKHKKSTAYIPYNRNETYHYFMGGVNGGERDAYYELIKHCYNGVHEDIKNGIMAIYHDESHLNAYLHNKSIKILSPAFGYPEDAELPFKPAVVILNKMKHGGKYFDKLPKTAYSRRIVLFVKRLYFAAIWKMGI